MTNISTKLAASRAARTAATVLLYCLAHSVHAQPAQYAKLQTDAEQLIAEGSYAKARELYAAADQMRLPQADARWVDFRLADSTWRAQAQTETLDQTDFDQALHELDVLVRDIKRTEDRDRVWAEVYESLGDFYWTRRQLQNWGQAWQHYEKALDWWAGSQQLELARTRYLKIVWTASSPPWHEPRWRFGRFADQLPRHVLENTLRIVATKEDRARANFLSAMRLRHGGWEDERGAAAAFEAAMTGGKSTAWYDDALYHYAEWLADRGRVVQVKLGQYKHEPDYVEALKLFRRLLAEFRKGETRYWDQAERKIAQITAPAVGVSVSNVFLPDSEIQYHLNWRNVERIELRLYAVDLTRDLQLAEDTGGMSAWIQRIAVGDRKPHRTWTKDVEGAKEHRPGRETLRLPEKLRPGAYLLSALAGTLEAREVILVTDMSVVLKAVGKQALTYVCDALTGAPVAGATVALYESYYGGDGNKWRCKRYEQQTRDDGTAMFELVTSSRHRREILAATARKQRQAFTYCRNVHSVPRDQGWRVYVFTDRPAYRPGDEVHWKVIARSYDGAVYTTPAENAVEFEINDARGNKVKTGQLTLNAFGCAWDTVDLLESMPLGVFRIRFWTKGRASHIGSATLLRLEEYKLPEFRVTVETPTEDGAKKTFRVGEKVEAVVRAEYYFGGPVAEATVEAVVYQAPFHHYWHPPREFPWFYDDMPGGRHYRHHRGGRGQVVARETLKTDAEGKASLTFDTPRGAGQDFEYRVEARVTDASRREVVGSDTVRVTRQGYYVDLRPEHNIHRPHEKVQVNVCCRDANVNRARF